MAYVTEAAIEHLTLPSDQDSSGRTLSEEEIAAVTEALRTGTLTSTKGLFVKKFEQMVAQTFGSGYAHACSSGTAAIHCAIAALDPEPGDEFITSAITDMGALTPILYQAAIPVFADVDPQTLNLTAETIAPRLSARTKAIIVTHLFGNPCQMGPILELARQHNIPVIEDCAQSFLARSENVYTGTLGTIGCFSTQQGKHITTGEGGFVLTNDPALARRMFLFINKAWGYGDKNPDHYFLALNYRMTELQGAVACAQMEKLAGAVSSRIETAEELSRQLEGLRGISLPAVAPADVHTYWKYIVLVDPSKIKGGAVRLAGYLKEFGINSAPRYIQKPAFECEIFQKQKTFGSSRFPFTEARPEALVYDRDLFPGTYTALEQVLVLPWNERYTGQHVDYIATCLKNGVEFLWSQD